MRYAGFWRRAAASIIDLIVMNLLSWVMAMGIFGAMWLVYAALARHNGAEVEPFGVASEGMVAQVVEAVIYLVLTVAYYIAWQTRRGATLGKQWLRIRVISVKSPATSAVSEMTPRQATLRYFGYLLSYLPVGCGFLMAAFHPQKRALHDLIAGTACIIKEG